MANRSPNPEEPSTSVDAPASKGRRFVRWTAAILVAAMSPWVQIHRLRAMSSKNGP